MHQSMSEVEQALHEGQDPAHFANLLQSAHIQLRTLVADLRSVQGVVPYRALPLNAVLTSTQLVEIQTVVQTLRKLLEQDDSEVQSLWDTNAWALHSVLPQAQELERAIQGFEFEEALRLIQLQTWK